MYFTYEWMERAWHHTYNGWHQLFTVWLVESPQASAVHTVEDGSLRSHLLHLMSPLNKATDTVGKYEDGVSSSTYSIIRCLLWDSLKISFKVQSIINDLIEGLITCRRFTNLIQRSKISSSRCDNLGQIFHFLIKILILPNYLGQKVFLFVTFR